MSAISMRPISTTSMSKTLASVAGRGTSMSMGLGRRRQHSGCDSSGGSAEGFGLGRLFGRCLLEDGWRECVGGWSEDERAGGGGLAGRVT